MKKKTNAGLTLLGLAADGMVALGGWCVQHAAFLVARPLGFLTLGLMLFGGAALLVLALRQTEERKEGDAD